MEGKDIINETSSNAYNNAMEGRVDQTHDKNTVPVVWLSTVWVFQTSNFILDIQHKLIVLKYMVQYSIC